ncbi:MAG: glycosyltransferase family 39 protein [Chloroflexi bacterium]|nr:glycosyltransferase family 39 protein [Chloroflexota bacterium]
MIKTKPNIKTIVFVIVTILLGIFSFLLICNRSMMAGDNHDEHQFIASGYLLATKGLLPYRDYAYFHMPNLVFVYALIDKLTGFRLLYTRLFSSLFGTFTVITIFLITYYLFRKKSFFVRLGVALLAALFLLANPLFAAVSGLAWNHDVSIFLTLLAALFYYKSGEYDKPYALVAISAGLLGLAIGTRLSFVTLIPAFLLTFKVHPKIKNAKDYWKMFFCFAFGGAVSMLPSIVLFCLAPKNFIFGNLIYARLNTLYRLENGFTDGMNLLSKIKYLSDYVFSNNANVLILISLFVFVVLPALRKYSQDKSWEFSSAFFALLATFCIVGSFLPTPTFYQYFYAPIPLIILGTIYTISRFEGQSNPNGIFLQFFIALVFYLSLIGMNDIALVRNVFNAERVWFSYKVHWQAEKISLKVVSRGVLTLNPFYAVEANEEIYPEFATGPFAFRVASLLSESDRKEYNLIASTDIGAFLDGNQPGGILVGRDPDLEISFIQYAVEHGYRNWKISDAFSLWVP